MVRKQTFSRRPNNSGTVVKLSGNRRKPYCARVLSNDRDIATGSKRQISIGTFKTKQEALNALALYSMSKSKQLNNQELMDLDSNLYQKIKDRQENMLTFYQIYEILDKEEFVNLSKSARAGYKAWIKHFGSIYDRKINTLSLKDLQFIFDNENCSKGTKIHMKVLCSKIFKYAVIHQLITKDDDYTEFINLGVEKAKEKKHYTFSFSEIKALENDNTELSKLILIYIFSGLRANELLNIKCENVFIDKEVDGMKISYLITGSKTESGKDRVVPIHNRIKPYIVELLKNNKDKLINRNYDTLKVQFSKSKYSNHTLHDTRVTFTTLCQKYKVDLFARKRILGHKLNDITFDTYTDTVITDLYQEINKIKL